jgi:hypothetical protein
MPSRNAAGWAESQVLNASPEAALHHVQQPCRAGAVPHRRQVDDHCDVLAAAAGVPPHMLIDADDLHPVEPAGVGDQHPPALGQDRVVGGVPRHRQPLGNPGHGQMLHDDAFQRPPQATARQPGPRLSGPAGVLPPHMPAPGAPVAPDRHQQDRRPPPQRLMRQTADHGIARNTAAAAPTAPPVRLDDPAREHRATGFEPLSGHLKSQVAKAAERGQVRTRKGTVIHVEVFRMGSVATPILRRPRRLSRHRHASPFYTPNCEEPDNDLETKR